MHLCIHRHAQLCSCVYTDTQLHTAPSGPTLSVETCPHVVTVAALCGPGTPGEADSSGQLEDCGLCSGAPVGQPSVVHFRGHAGGTQVVGELSLQHLPGQASLAQGQYLPAYVCSVTLCLHPWVAVSAFLSFSRPLTWLPSRSLVVCVPLFPSLYSLSSCSCISLSPRHCLAVCLCISVCLSASRFSVQSDSPHVLRLSLASCPCLSVSAQGDLSWVAVGLATLCWA